MRKMTIDQIKEEALIYGYDFEGLIESLKGDGVYEKEYIYGYTLAEDKISYLESMAENKVIHCDRIQLFKNEIKEYLKKVEGIPHTRIFSGFYVLEGMNKEDGQIVDASIFRIISFNDQDKTGIVKDIEYVYDDPYDESLAIYTAELDYEEATKIMEIGGSGQLLDVAVELVDSFIPDEILHL